MTFQSCGHFHAGETNPSCSLLRISIGHFKDLHAGWRWRLKTLGLSFIFLFKKKKKGNTDTMYWHIWTTSEQHMALNSKDAPSVPPFHSSLPPFSCALKLQKWVRHRQRHRCKNRFSCEIVIKSVTVAEGSQILIPLILPLISFKLSPSPHYFISSK